MEQNSFTQTVSPATGRSTGAEPVIPLPNPGEGGPVYPGDTDAGAEPVVPLPNPGEGGPVYPGGGDLAGVPVIPLPNPGEGGPVYPGNTVPNPGGSGSGPVVIIPPQPGNSGGVTGGNVQWGCNNNGFCSTVLPGIIGAVWPSAAKVRFLNAAYNYPAFRIFVGNTRFSNLLNYASVSAYGRVSVGYQTVTVTGTDGYVYIQKTMPFQASTATTIAIINTASGMDLLQISDSTSLPTNGYSNFRIGNLAYNSGPMDVLMSDGRVVYSDGCIKIGLNQKSLYSKGALV